MKHSEAGSHGRSEVDRTSWPFSLTLALSRWEREDARSPSVNLHALVRRDADCVAPSPSGRGLGVREKSSPVIGASAYPDGVADGGERVGKNALSVVQSWRAAGRSAHPAARCWAAAAGEERAAVQFGRAAALSGRPAALWEEKGVQFERAAVRFRHPAACSGHAAAW